jgi:GAF domain-containing protein
MNKQDPERPPNLSTPQQADRVSALRSTGLLDSLAEEAFDRLTRLATQVIHVPVSLVSLVDEKRQFFKSAQGLPEPWSKARETPLTHSFCQHIANTGDPLIVTNSLEHPLVKENLAVRDLGVLAYAGVPLTLPNGLVLGTLCVIDHQPRNWTEGEIALLCDLAASAMTEIELRLALRSREEILKVLSHDLKNPITGISMICELTLRRFQSGQMEQEKVLEAVMKVKSSADRMKVQLIKVLDQA